MRGAPRDPRTYELMIVISPEVPEEEIQTVIDRTGDFITGPGGTVTSVNRESPWGRRRLAYAIRHNSRDVRDGFYTLYQFSIEPHKIEDIEREIRLTDRIIRHMVTQYTPRPEAPPSEQTEGEGDEETSTDEAQTAATAVVAESPVEEAVSGGEVESPVDEAPAAEPEVAEAAADVAQAEDGPEDVVIDETPAATEA